jgi:GNAT superfamily N-acetyltransferase
MNIRIEILADNPELIASVGQLRWKEWGRPPEPDRLEEWIAITEKEAGKSFLPITWVAGDEGTHAVGAVGLAKSDIQECGDRSPWVIGTIVAEQQRGKGIGGRLLNALESRAKNKEYSKLWVGTGGRAATFYTKCGWRFHENILRPSGETVTILRKEL